MLNRKSIEIKNVNKLIWIYNFSTKIRYTTALNDSLNQFKSLLSNPNSKSWKLLPSTSIPTSSTSTTSTSTSFNPINLSLDKGKSRETSTSSSFNNSKGHQQQQGWSLGTIDSNSINLHKKRGKSRYEADIIRCSLEVNLNGVNPNNSVGGSKGWLEGFESVLRTPEIRNSCKS